MDYAQALKHIQASKKEAKPPFLKVNMGWERRFVFPYKEGLAFLAALECAEQVYEDYSKPANIGEVTASINIEPMNHSEYMAYKISNLLQISLENAKALQSNQGIPE